MKHNIRALLITATGLALCLFASLTEARGGGGFEGPGAFLFGAPIYWFLARHYLKKITHQIAVACILLLVMAALGPWNLVAGCIGVAATYFMCWPFLLPKDRIHPGLHSTIIVVNFIVIVAVAIIGFGVLTEVVPRKW